MSLDATERRRATRDREGEPIPRRAPDSMSEYVPLWVKSNGSFLEGASHPEELVETAQALGLDTLALTDRDSVNGLVRAWVRANEVGVRLIAGAQVTVGEPPSRRGEAPLARRVVLLAETREGYGAPLPPPQRRARPPAQGRVAGHAARAERGGLGARRARARSDHARPRCRGLRRPPLRAGHAPPASRGGRPGSRPPQGGRPLRRPPRRRRRGALPRARPPLPRRRPRLHPSPRDPRRGRPPPQAERRALPALGRGDAAALPRPARRRGAHARGRRPLPLRALAAPLSLPDRAPARRRERAELADAP